MSAPDYKSLYEECKKQLDAADESNRKHIAFEENLVAAAAKARATYNADIDRLTTAGMEAIGDRNIILEAYERELAENKRLEKAYDEIVVEIRDMKKQAMLFAGDHEVIGEFAEEFDDVLFPKRRRTADR